jgi:hypothetical protein
VTAIGLGWRIHSWWAVAVAVSGDAVAPVVIRRERITLLDDASVQEPYHAAVGRPLDEAMAFIESVGEAAASAVAATIRDLASSLGSVATVGVVGGDRQLPAELSKRLASHAMWHASERDLFERAVVEGAMRAGLPVTTVPATAKLFDHASRVLGVELGPALAALGASMGPPWSKNYKEAAAAALVALDAAT